MPDTILVKEVSTSTAGAFAHITATASEEPRYFGVPVLRAPVRVTGERQTFKVSPAVSAFYIHIDTYAGFQLAFPLKLQREVGQGGQIVLTDSGIGVYGAGKTLKEALDDYLSMLVDLYTDLAASERMLSRQLKQQLDHLRTLLSPIP